MAVDNEFYRFLQITSFAPIAILSNISKRNEEYLFYEFSGDRYFN